jgi:hypothetical protein
MEELIMEKKFFAAKRGNVFRRKSDGVVIGRFVIDTTIENYEEVVDERPRSQRMNPHRPSFMRKLAKR